ncbi:TlpA disulfide reductase family protein [Mesonia sp. MT50]|uniref:TlpA disulfide reductase family protein n=1 Tax=Mesonia profundi TaxID=3070998 RepID=A0ABU1A007_9FLAO|nr:TlpA disulfide reductase family protein [Mesonia profundi]MDQ7916031.1 TlpA disulfide reductase family protein [Mesonia profundi]
MKFNFLLLLFLCFSCENTTQTSEEESNPIDTSSLTKIQRMESVSYGKESPDATLKDSNESTIAIKSFRGKLLVIDFWATWCSPCLKEAPIFKEIAEKYKDSNVEFITISIDQDYEDWKSYVLEKKWNGKNYWFGMQEDKSLYSFLYSNHKVNEEEVILVRLPKYVIISPNGKILSNSDLRPSKPEFELEIKKNLK